MEPIYKWGVMPPMMRTNKKQDNPFRTISYIHRIGFTSSNIRTRSSFLCFNPIPVYLLNIAIIYHIEYSICGAKYKWCCSGRIDTSMMIVRILLQLRSVPLTSQKFLIFFPLASVYIYT